MGVMAPQFISDHDEDTLRVDQDVVIPEAKDEKALALQKVRAAAPLFRLAVVLTTIDLGDQLGSVTDGIGDGACDGALEGMSSQRFSSVMITPSQPSPIKGEGSNRYR